MSVLAQTAVAALQVPETISPVWIWAAAALGAGAIAAALAITLVRTARRALFSSSREIVRAAEQLAEGRFEHVAVLPPGDPLAPAGVALKSLAELVQAKTNDLERRIQMLEEILGSARDSVYVLTDFEGDIRYASVGAEALFGWANGEWMGRNVASLFPPEEYEAFLPKLSRRALRDGPIRYEAKLLGGGGTVFRASLRIGPSKHLPGGGEGWFLEIRDVSGEERLRQDLKESEVQHRTLVEQLPIGVFVVQDGRFVYGNAALKDLLALDEVAGRDFRESLASEDLLRVLDRLRRAETGEETSFTIDCSLRPAREPWPIDVRLSASRTAYGGHPAVIGSVRDIGPDRDALRRVLVSEAKLDAAIEASEDGVLLLGAAPSGGTVTLGNRRFEELFGLSPRALAGLSLEGLAEALAPLFANPAEIRDYLRRLASGKDENPTLLLETIRPLRRVFEVSSRAARDRRGRVLGSLLVLRDVTAHKEQQKRLTREAEELARMRDLLERTNRELAEVNRELQKRTADVERANQELRTLDEMKSNLLANVSHELQTPLVSIKGYTELILKGRLGAVTDEQRKGLDVSLRNIDRLIGMINNLLNFSRIERDMSSMRIESWPLHQLVEETIDVVREAATELRIAITTRYMTDDLIVKADREKISQVFLNLLSNAIKYNREGGQVEVDVRKGKKGYLIVDVRDTGVGIPKDSLERIFERFYREPGGSGSGQPAAAGSGIGLAIVRDILRMHGCIIKADSRQGEGSVFTFTLPLAATAEAEAAGPGSSAGPVGGDAYRDPFRSR